MRILFINDYESHGGAENYIRDVMDEFERDHEVKLLTLSGADSDIDYREAGMFSYIEKFFSPLKQRKLRGEIRGFDPDVIHVHNIHKGTIPTLRVLSKLDAPVIKTFHDYGYFCVCPYAMHGEKSCEGIPEKCWSEGEINIKQYLFRKPLHSLRLNYLQSFDEILAPSKDLKSLIENFANAEVLPNFVDTEKFHPAEDVEKEGVLFVGRVTEEKGIRVLIDALANTDISGKVVGGGDIEKYRRIAEERNADLDFEGYLEERELVKAYQEAECTVVPSVFRESFNLVGLESLACGTPVIVSNTGGMQDYVEDGRNGYLFDNSNPDKLREKIRGIKEDEFERNHSLVIGNRFKMSEHFRELSNMYKEVESNL